ncbi:MAG: NAD-dependent epimerase/dehydratase family protein [Candidatus Omnitrophica bacterium]|nr:NAD-dependent epimerase/dehydratase family protein [Candidatus Omnitrophota bacterium]
MERILITGGCGFVGSSLAVDFVQRGCSVTVLDNLSRPGTDILLEKRILPAGIEFVHGDVRNPADLDGLAGVYDVLIECSAEASVLAGTAGRDVRYLLDVNLQGAINCFEWSRKRLVPVIFLSSSRVYPYDRLNACRYSEMETRFELEVGCPGVSSRGVQVEMPLQGIRSFYGASKLCAEFLLQEYAAQYHLPAIINRCGVIAGPWQLGKSDQGIFTYWLARHYFKHPLKYIGFGGSGKQVRDLLHVQDLSELVAFQVQCLIRDGQSYRGEVFNVGGSLQSNLSLREATEICARLTGNTLPVGSVVETRPSDIVWYVTDNGRTETVFSWKPKRSASQILEDIYRWLRDNENVMDKFFLE